MNEARVVGSCATPSFRFFMSIRLQDLENSACSQSWKKISFEKFSKLDASMVSALLLSLCT